MTTSALRAVIALALVHLPTLAAEVTESAAGISLAGRWAVRLDPENSGLRELRQTGRFADSLRLPGSLTENGFGEDVSVATRWTCGILDSSWFTDEQSP